MNIFYKKYIKYKNKYLQLKNQIGGVEKHIYKFHPKGTKNAMAEAITYGTLSEQMTQHGLGTGIYGFIDPEADYAQTYRQINNMITKVTLNKPLFLNKTNNIETDDDYIETNDLGMFTTLSTGLNILCYHYYNENKKINNENIEINKDDVIVQLEKNYVSMKEENSNIMCQLTLDIYINIDIIITIIKEFLNDYNYLMNTNEEDEHYILMPINYLMYKLDYDGIINLIDYTGRTGSIKYIFDNSIEARGNKMKFKFRKDNLKGKLIFLGKLYN